VEHQDYCQRYDKGDERENTPDAQSRHIMLIRHCEPIRQQSIVSSEYGPQGARYVRNHKRIADQARLIQTWVQAVERTYEV